MANKFKIGDVIVGLKHNLYAITGEDSINVVVKVYDDDDDDYIRVACVSYRNNSYYDVESDSFRLATPEDLIKLSAEIRDRISNELLELGLEGQSKSCAIYKVIFNDPATIVLWYDGTKTVVKCQKDKGDTYNKETGLAMAICKKLMGNDNTFNKVINKWVPNE